VQLLVSEIDLFEATYAKKQINKLFYELKIYDPNHTTTVLRPFFRVSRCQKRTSGLYGAMED